MAGERAMHDGDVGMVAACSLMIAQVVVECSELSATKAISVLKEAIRLQRARAPVRDGDG